MAKYAEFLLEGCISVPEEMDEVEFLDKFIEVIEEQGWFYGGGINGYTEDKKSAKSEYTVPGPFMFDTKDEAVEILDRMRDCVRMYGVTLVSDLLYVVNVIPRAVDHKYGWTDLRNAEIIGRLNGYELWMPRALPIE